MKKLFFGILSFMTLAACTQTKPDIVIRCPKPPVYAPADQAALAREIQAHGNEVPYLVSREVDYDRLQGELNQCNGFVPNYQAPQHKGWF